MTSAFIGPNQNRSTVISQKGMVCTSHPLATMAGIDTLKEGGNAIDAAICANATLCVVEPMSCGLGGDLFAIVWMEKDKKLYGLNASGRAPFNWSIKAARAMGLKAIPSQAPSPGVYPVVSVVGRPGQTVRKTAHGQVA